MELVMIYVTAKLQKDLEVQLLQTTSSWMFIVNVITSGFEIQSSCSDIGTLWADYEVQRTLIEKPLTFKNLAWPRSDAQWVHKDIDIELDLPDLLMAI